MVSMRHCKRDRVNTYVSAVSTSAVRSVSALGSDVVELVLGQVGEVGRVGRSHFS